MTPLGSVPADADGLTPDWLSLSLGPVESVEVVAYPGFQTTVAVVVSPRFGSG